MMVVETPGLIVPYIVQQKHTYADSGIRLRMKRTISFFRMDEYRSAGYVSEGATMFVPAYACPGPYCSI